MNNKISLIIPSNANKFYVEDFILNISFWTLKPNEIIIINTKVKKFSINLEVIKKFKQKKIQIRIVNKKGLYPGAARNLGIKYSKFNYLCFLDINTVVYDNNWLKLNIKFMQKNKVEILVGQTLYLANNEKEKLIIASTYGFKKLTTLPGTLIKKELFKKLGFFNNKTRAGEDTDWLLRLKKSNFKSLDIIEPIYYKGLYEMTYTKIIKKWFRNYQSSSDYSHLFNQKMIYLTPFALGIFIFLINIYLINFNQNLLNQVFLQYLSIIFILYYIALRGIYLPLKKNTKINFLLPVNIFKIFFFSFILYLVKVSSFLLSTLFKKIKL